MGGRFQAKMCENPRQMAVYALPIIPFAAILLPVNPSG